MTKGEINSLCAEIDKLLNDICKFLNEEIEAGCLSDNGRKIAGILIERSKKQLQTISMTIESDTSDSIIESYVDMQAYKVSLDEKYPEPQEVYSDVSLTYEPSFRPSATDEQLVCPFINLPAYEVKNGKTGFLYKKEKILFFEQQRKIYAAIQQNWFLVYINENSHKPSQFFDLYCHEVRTSQKDVKKRNESFELVNTADLKLYQFTAQTSKDMYQWIAAIKQQIDSLISTNTLSDVVENDIDHYEPLKDYMIKEKNIPTSPITADPPLPLPPRNATIKKASKVQTFIPRTPSTGSLSSDYDSVGNALILPSRETSNSFSEDDSDMHYDDPSELRLTNLPPYVKQYEASKDDDDDNDIYDYLEKPTFPPNVNFDEQIVTSPLLKSMPEAPKNEIKPKPDLKPKLILSLRNRRKDNV